LILPFSLRPGGILIFDFERTSQIVWGDVGRAIADSWRHGQQLIVRVSVGQIASHVLYSDDVYVIDSKFYKPIPPNERSRYHAIKKNGNLKVYVDRSCVRFFSIEELREFARDSGFKLIANFVLPRNRYKRSYAVFKRSN
jgi:hypothetical protein